MLFESLAGETHEFRASGEIPIRVSSLGMTEVCRQHRQPSLGVLTISVTYPNAVIRQGLLLLRVVGCLPRAEITSERHSSEGQASDKPQRTKPRAQLLSLPQAERAYGDSAGVRGQMIAA